MATRKGWLTPENGSTEYECRPVFIPLDDDLSYMAAVNGALNELTKAENWEQFGALTPEEAAEAMLEMYTRYTEEECCEEPPICPPPEMTIGDPELGYEGPLRIIRRGAGGHTEVLQEDGTWEPPTGDLEPPAVPPRTGGTLDDKLCLASANAANVLADLYEEVTDQVQISTAPAAVFGVIYDYVNIILGVFAGPTAAAYASLGKLFFDAFIETADTLGSDVWDSDFTDELTCFLLNYAQSDGSNVITFEWPVARQAITDKFVEAIEDADVDKGLLWGQVGYLFDLIAADGLDLAGATTAITTYDCQFCECTGPIGIAGVTNFESGGGKNGWDLNPADVHGSWTGTNWGTAAASPNPRAAISKSGAAGIVTAIKVKVRACQTVSLTVAVRQNGVVQYIAAQTQAANGCAVSGLLTFTLPANICGNWVDVTIATPSVGNGAISYVEVV